MNDHATRADARKNREALLDAARAQLEMTGAETSAREIADRAGVGVGTLYRRFGSKEALIAEALEQILESVVEQAREARADPDPWDALCRLVSTMAAAQRDNVALEKILAGRQGDKDFPAQRTLRNMVREATDRARSAGMLRADITWIDVLFLPKTTLTATHSLGVKAPDEQWIRNLTIALEGMRP